MHKRLLSAAIATLVASIAVSEAAADPTATANGWIVEENDSPELLRAMLSPIRKMGIPVIARAYSVSLTRGERSSQTWIQRRRTIDDLVATLSSQLQDEQFGELSNTDVAAKFGMDAKEITKQMKKGIIEGLPYAQRESQSKSFDAPIHFLVNSSAQCTRDDEGLLLAEMSGLYAIEDATKDFGGVMVVILAGGDCATESTYLNRVKRDLRIKLTSFLER